MFMLDKESGAIKRERAGPSASALAITPGTAVTTTPKREVHSNGTGMAEASKQPH